MVTEIYAKSTFKGS